MTNINVSTQLLKVFRMDSIESAQNSNIKIFVTYFLRYQVIIYWLIVFFNMKFYLLMIYFYFLISGDKFFIHISAEVCLLYCISFLRTLLMRSSTGTYSICFIKIYVLFL